MYDVVLMDDLEALAIRRFGKLSEAEERLLRAAPQGEWAVCGPNRNDDDPANDPSKADHLPEAGGWGSEREIRAELIRWLCVDPSASKRIDPHGVNVYAAKIRSCLDLSFANISFPLFLTRCRLADCCEFRYVKMPGLYLNGSSLGTAETSAETFALNLEGAQVSGSVFLKDGFSSVGKVWLLGARIGEELNCMGGSFKNPGGIALDAERAEVVGIVALGDGFAAEGEVRLCGAQMGFLECRGGEFSQLSLCRATIRGILSWHDVDGAGVRVDFTNASVGALWDDVASWPERGKLLMDGFVYQSILSGPTSADERLDWLDRQDEFRPQPYRQLAKVLRERGDDDGAKQVLYEMESRVRAAERKRLAHSPLRWLFRSCEAAVYDATVGYGIYPGRAIWCACGLTALGWIVHRRAQRVGAMAPTDKDAYAEFREGKGPRVRYQPFSPLIYSVENCIPLVKLGQDERWQPDPDPHLRVPLVAAGKFERVRDYFVDAFVPDWAVTPMALRWLRWIMIGLGWLLATFFVAGLTGIIKTN